MQDIQSEYDVMLKHQAWDSIEYTIDPTLGKLIFLFLFDIALFLIQPENRSKPKSSSEKNTAFGYLLCLY